MFKFFSKRKKYETKILYILIFFMIILVLLLYFSFSELYLKSVSDELLGISERNVAQKEHLTEAVFNQCLYLAMDIYSDLEMSEYINSIEYNPILASKVVRNLSIKKHAYSFAHSIVLYNAKLESFIGDVEYLYSKNGSRDLKKIIDENKEKKVFVFSQEIDKGESYEKENVITFLLYEQTADYSDGRNAILINVYDNVFYRDDVDPNILLYSNDHSFVLGDIDKQSEQTEYKNYLNKVFKSNKISDSSILKIGNDVYVVSYCKNEKYGYILLDKTLYSVLIEDKKRIQNKFLLISFIVLFVGLAIAFIFSKYLYKPINKLVNEFSARAIIGDTEKYNDIEYISKSHLMINNVKISLEKKNKEQTNIIKHRLIRELLTDRSETNKIYGMLHEYGDLKNISNRYMLLIEVDKLSDIGNNQVDANGKNNDKLINDFLISMVQNRLGKKNDCEVIYIKDGVLSVLYYDYVIFDEILNAIKIMQNEVLTEVDRTISVAIVKLFNMGYKDLGKAYESCKKLLSYRIIYGKEKVFFNEWIEKNINSDFSYPIELERNFVREIREYDKESINQNINDLYECGKGWQCSHFKYVVLQIVFVCLKEANIIYEKNNLNIIADYSNIVNELDNIYGKDEFVDWMNRFFLKCHELLINSSPKFEAKNKKYINETIEYIKVNYDDSNISATTLAEMANMSSSYFSIMFKEISGYSFSDYLAMIRILEAKKLLEETNMSVKEIAPLCGFLNVNYFYSFFKKHTGMTPTTYRSNNIC